MTRPTPEPEKRNKPFLWNNNAKLDFLSIVILSFGINLFGSAHVADKCKHSYL